jgi:hypothetical protein
MHSNNAYHSSALFLSISLFASSEMNDHVSLATTTQPTSVHCHLAMTTQPTSEHCHLATATATQSTSVHCHLNVSVKHVNDEDTNQYVLCRMKVHLLVVGNWQHLY